MHEQTGFAHICNVDELDATRSVHGQTTLVLDAKANWFAVLEVDERDIADVVVGQSGQLAVASMPGERFVFTVSKITPVNEAKDGRNFFRVEALLDSDIGRLRPGMEGVGKILVDERKLIWIWTHSLVDWARLTLWSWMP